MIQFLLPAGEAEDANGVQVVDVNCRTEDGWTPLHGATVRGHIMTLERLVECGAVVDAPATNGETPLHLASKVANREQVDNYVSHILGSQMTTIDLTYSVYT